MSSGHEIRAVVSADAETRRWAAGQGIPSFVPGPGVAKQMKMSFDYLFSIVNEHILDESVLQLPRKLAINYHDGPLPRYAGTHATSWALINGEATHGVTWHVIAGKVDAGDILVQKSVAIDVTDTALTLNTKCFEAAINSFTELIENLSEGKANRAPQDESLRTFYGRFKRPQNGGLISWSDSAAKITNTVRALNFGNHPNPLGTAKIAIGDQIFCILKCEELDSTSKSAFGTINRIEFDSITVSALDTEVRISQISTLNGKSVSISDLAATFGLTVGARLRTPDAEELKRIDGIIESVCRHEGHWVRSIQGGETLSPPFATNGVSDSPTTFANCRIPVPAGFLKYLNDIGVQAEHHKYLIAAFIAMLGRLSGVDRFDVAFSGYALRAEIEGLEHLFADHVPFTVSVAEHATFEDFGSLLGDELDTVTRRKTYLLDVYSRFLQLRERGEFRSPIVIATVQGDSDFQPTAKTEIAFVVSETAPECYVTYDPSKFPLESVTRLTDHFGIFVSAIAKDPLCKVAYLPLITEPERRKLLIEWNDLKRTDSKNEKAKKQGCDSIVQLFEAQVKRDAMASALVFGDKEMSYKELNSRANQVARYLRSVGVSSDVLVGICLARSVEMIVGLLAVLKAGGAYVPLDPGYPQERIDHMLKDSKAGVLLTDERHANSFDNYDGIVISLDGEIERIGREDNRNLPDATVTRRPDDLAYVIYTSGSTGAPKGVAIEHRNTLALLEWAMTVYSREQLKGTLASTSICFDLSVFEVFLPLSCGGTIILVENILHLPGLSQTVEVTMINTVPSAIAELLRINGIPASVNTVNLAGEALKSSLVERIYSIETVEKVYDLYGPTEDTTYSTFKLRDLGKASIGRPITGTQAYILDRHLQPVPIGIAGELYLGGAGLARGYLNQPELTAEKFIKNPFDDDPSPRIYKTGDLARFLDNGDIEYLGRIDNQVKIRGFRIELGEIETKLAGYAGIREVVVVAREDGDGEKRLVAYFVAKDGGSIDRHELRDYLSQRLPDFMVPSAFVELTEIPLTPNGKIDRKGLPAPSPRTTGEQGGFVAHRDDLEAELVKIWESILGIDPIGIHDNFFELGGHSLKAVRMFAEIEERFGKNIPLATLFESGTVEKLAAILRQDGWAEPESSLVPIQPNGTKPPFFCVHAKGGNVLFYRPLAKYLGNDQPFYGLQARRVGGRQVGHATVEEMAEFYIKEIQTVQPQGPYYLGGSSFGGLAAFEIARRLLGRGEKIALLALLDTGTPDYPKRLPNTTALRSKVYRLIRRVQHHRDTLAPYTNRERADHIVARLKKVNLKFRRKISHSYKKAARAYYLKFKGKGSTPANYIVIEDQISKAGRKFVPKVYPGRVTLFRASNQPLGIQPDPTLGWGNIVAGDLEIHEVPGHHGSIVAEPFVRILAEKLRECIESALLEETRVITDGKDSGVPARVLQSAAKKTESLKTCVDEPVSATKDGFLAKPASASRNGRKLAKSSGVEPFS